VNVTTTGWIAKIEGATPGDIVGWNDLGSSVVAPDGTATHDYSATPRLGPLWPGRRSIVIRAPTGELRWRGNVDVNTNGQQPAY
jgi:hypothetical protein